MAEIKAPVVIDGYKCVEDIAQAVRDYRYNGKTLKEWADRIAGPKTNADRFRAMTDEELAGWLATNDTCPSTEQERKCDNRCGECWLEWLKKEADDGST